MMSSCLHLKTNPCCIRMKNRHSLKMNFCCSLTMSFCYSLMTIRCNLTSFCSSCRMILCCSLKMNCYLCLRKMILLCILRWCFCCMMNRLTPMMTTMACGTGLLIQILRKSLMRMLSSCAEAALKLRFWQIARMSSICLCGFLCSCLRGNFRWWSIFLQKMNLLSQSWWSRSWCGALRRCLW